MPSPTIHTETLEACAQRAAPLTRTSKGRVIALGDIHGDLAAARAALRAAQVIDEQGQWRGGTTTVVQTGDILDRGNEEQALLDWFESLERQASAAGGAFIWLVGNHEAMNAAGDFRYVTAGGFADFGDAAGRQAALAPGGTYGALMAEQPVVAIIDGVVYSHAGVNLAWADDIASLRRQASCWFAADASAMQPPIGLTAPDGPVWTREFGGASVDCEGVARALQQLGASKMVVGHTVQATGINGLCDGTLWRIDAGMAAHYGGVPQALELVVGEAPRVIVASAAQ